MGKLCKALDKLCILLVNWGLSKRDFVIVDEFAYLLQGYNLKGPELKKRHLDVYVDPRVLPWSLKHQERSVIPPLNSEFMLDYENFMESTGFSLDLLTADPEILKEKKVFYYQARKTIPLMEVVAMTEQFVRRTLLHYTLDEVGKEKIIEWIKKLERIETLAKSKKEVGLVRLTGKMLPMVRSRWSGKV